MNGLLRVLKKIKKNAKPKIRKFVKRTLFNVVAVRVRQKLCTQNYFKKTTK